jgi:hypothetical protein
MKAALLPLAAALALATLAPQSAASELKREWISPDAQLVLHFDIEGFQRTTIWKLLLEHKDDFEFDELDEIRDEFGIDPFVDLKSITAYSTEDDNEDGVALVVATANIENALVRLRKEKDYSLLMVDGLELHVWTEDGEEDGVAYIHDIGNGERVVVLSDSQARTIEAARIVRGEAPNHLNAGADRLPITPAFGSFFYLTTASLPGLDDLPPASRIAGLTKNIHVDVGETNGSLNASIAVMTGAPEDAVQASKMIEGFKAIGYFAAQDLGVANLLEAIRVDTRGSEILITFSYNVRNLVEEIKALEDNGHF